MKGFLSSLKEKSLSAPVSVTDLIIRNISGYKKDRSHKTIHASDVTKEGFCPRFFALLDTYNEEKDPQYLSTAMQATFDMGNAVADLVREEWCGANVVGNWRCVVCNEQRTFCRKPKTSKCKNGGKCQWKYDEVVFIHDDSGVSGSIDMIVDLGATKFTVVELKIMAPSQFDTLAAPLAEHRIRTSLYLEIIEGSNSIYKDRVDTSKAIVFYVSRGYGKKCPQRNEILPFKEFWVTRDIGSSKGCLDLAKKVKDFREGGEMPAKICGSLEEGLARKCPMAKKCFLHNDS